jgi:hypothetical protein
MIKVLQVEIDEKLDNAQVEERIFFDNKLLVVAYLLTNGFVVLGKAGVIHRNNFDLERGREIARKDASDQLWLLEGYKRHGDALQ